jgi:hypothetical protein
MKKILYIVATQYDNMGDLLINKCFVDELASYGSVYLDTKKVPAPFKAVLLEKENVHELSEISSISLKGFGLFRIPFAKNQKFDFLFKSPGPFGGSHTANQKIRAWLFYLIFLFYKGKGTKSFLMGNDFMLQTPFDSKIVKKYSKVLSGMYLRSEKNVMQVKDLGVPNVAYSPDFCFMMNVQSDVAKIRVGVSFRDMGETDNLRIIKAVERYVKYFLSQGYAIDFFYQVERDRNFNLALYDAVSGPNVFFRNGVLKWEERDFYADKLFLLSNRLHVLLLGQMYAGIPLAFILGHANTQKIHDIFHTVGLQELLLDEIKVNQLEEFHRSQQELQQRIKEVNNEQKQIFKSRLDKML